jgi:hypothetical protein
VILSSLALLAEAMLFRLAGSLSFLLTLSYLPHVLTHDPIATPEPTVDGIPFSTRVYWMRQANAVLAELASPCPFGAFGTVVVNHTDNYGLGELVCIGVNSLSEYGNPTLHGILPGTLNDAANLIQ